MIALVRRAAPAAFWCLYTYRSVGSAARHHSPAPTAIGGVAAEAALALGIPSSPAGCGDAIERITMRPTTPATIRKGKTLPDRKSTVADWKNCDAALMAREDHPDAGCPLHRQQGEQHDRLHQNDQRHRAAAVPAIHEDTCHRRQEEHGQGFRQAHQADTSARLGQREDPDQDHRALAPGGDQAEELPGQKITKAPIG